MSKRKEAPSSSADGASTAEGGAAASESSSSASPAKKKKKITNSDFNGWWKLDLENSDTMEKYLGAMRLNDIAIQAALKGERDVATLQKFHMTTTSVTIERRSRMGNNVTKMVFGKPILKTMSTGEKTMTATRTPDGGIKVLSRMPLATGMVTITDIRSVDTDGNLRQVLTTSDVKETETNRCYKRTEEPPALPVIPPPPAKTPKKEKKAKK